MTRRVLPLANNYTLIILIFTQQAYFEINNLMFFVETLSKSFLMLQIILLAIIAYISTYLVPEPHVHRLSLEWKILTRNHSRDLFASFLGALTSSVQ